jgi:hypothetical protein
MGGLKGKSGPPGNMKAIKHGLRILHKLASPARFGPVIRNVCGVSKPELLGCL